MTRGNFEDAARMIASIEGLSAKLAMYASAPIPKIRDASAPVHREPAFNPRVIAEVRHRLEQTRRADHRDGMLRAMREVVDPPRSLVPTP